MAKVIAIRQFKEVHHDGHVYKPGDPYPAYGFKAVAKRVSFLSEVHPKLGHVYLKEEEEQGTEKEEVTTKAEKKTETKTKSKNPADEE
ncbi:hypothetical protein ACFPYN_03040 [Paenisporosarcina macmurdoensis]|uniref:Phage protein n=1 Tax=Paenisporosarcina macmurdoensis TaxID=212659 RepID=A0ABW1L554_9BACL